jgi:predicted SprT family Zn-dependent metalloprotease
MKSFNFIPTFFLFYNKYDNYDTDKLGCDLCGNTKKVSWVEAEKGYFCKRCRRGIRKHGIKKWEDIIIEESGDDNLDNEFNEIVDNSKHYKCNNCHLFYGGDRIRFSKIDNNYYCDDCRRGFTTKESDEISLRHFDNKKRSIVRIDKIKKNK